MGSKYLTYVQLTLNGGFSRGGMKDRIKQRAKFKEYVWMYLATHPCVDCGEKDPVVLEFDHVRGEKRCEISRAIYHGTWVVLLAEIEKCDIRCANCHRRKTAKDQGWNKATKV